ncbi:MAG: M20/M25/M40 family metallo-hydrolase [Promethearchaeota archaeon]
MVLENLDPKLVWTIFEDVIAKTPHCSFHEEKLRENLKSWVKEFADKKGLEINIKEDTKGNIFFSRKATPGMESVSPLLLQAHLDMVCVTDLPDGFNFQEKPLQLRIQSDNEWVEAVGTSLGGDDGIGLAIAIALLVDPTLDFDHGTLEVLCTVEEETGMGGANSVDFDNFGIRANHLINLDGLTTGLIVTGSAGGERIVYERKFEKKGDFEEFNHKFIHLSVKGLRSGHSGAEIHLPRANAIKLLARMLTFITQKLKINITEWNGGDMLNVIPKQANVTFAVDQKDYDTLKKLLQTAKDTIFSYYQSSNDRFLQFEPNMEISWEKGIPKPFFSIQDSYSIISLINILPNGPIEISPNSTNALLGAPFTGVPAKIKEYVRLSNNLAIVETNINKITIRTYYRGNILPELLAFSYTMKQYGELTGWTVQQSGVKSPYKSPDSSSFINFIEKIYKSHLKREPSVLNLHVGLELSIFVKKHPNLEMVSMGPTVSGVHSTSERIRIPDVELFYKFLKDFFKKFAVWD